MKDSYALQEAIVADEGDHRSSEVVKIRVGRGTVGIPALGRIFEEVRGLALRDRETIEEELLSRVKKASYLPEAAEDSYREALFREFRRFLGDPVEDESGFRVIRVLGPGCPRCETLMNRVLSVLEQDQIKADVEHVRDPNDIASYGVLATPGLVVDGKVVTSGKVPSIDDLRHIFQRTELSEHALRRASRPLGQAA
jgi:small redox-active disulfide protein 2